MVFFLFFLMHLLYLTILYVYIHEREQPIDRPWVIVTGDTCCHSIWYFTLEFYGFILYSSLSLFLHSPRLSLFTLRISPLSPKMKSGEFVLITKETIVDIAVEELRRLEHGNIKDVKSKIFMQNKVTNWPVVMEATRASAIVEMDSAFIIYIMMNPVSISFFF